MTKFVSISINLSVIFLTLPIGIGAAQPIGLEPVDLVCYMQTADGQTINLTSICGKRIPPVATTNSSSTADRASLSRYTDLGGLDIYGRGSNAPPCFGLDDQGRSCPSSASGN